MNNDEYLEKQNDKDFQFEYYDEASNIPKEMFRILQSNFRNEIDNKRKIKPLVITSNPTNNNYDNFYEIWRKHKFKPLSDALSDEEVLDEMCDNEVRTLKQYVENPIGDLKGFLNYNVIKLMIDKNYDIR